MRMPGGNAAPEFRLTSVQFPEIKDWEVGKTYKLEVEIKVRGKTEGQQYAFDSGNKDLTTMAFDVTSIKCEPEEDDD